MISFYPTMYMPYFVRTTQLLGVLCVFGLFMASEAQAQDVQTGYLKVDHTIYDAPHGTAVKKLTRGTHVEAHPAAAQANWYRILVHAEDGTREEVGYTLNPWLDATAPPELGSRTVALSEPAAPPTKSNGTASSGRWVLRHRSR